MQVENILQEYELTEKEARIYLAGLELGIVPASMIARKIGENRITVYSALQMLCKKGMSSEHTKNGKKYYMMIDPKDFHGKMKQQCSRLKEVLPQLLALSSGGIRNKPKVSYYEGFDGIKKIYEDKLNEGKTISLFTGITYLDVQMTDFLYNFQQERIEKKIYTKIIYSAFDMSKEYYEKFCANADPKKTYKEVRYSTSHLFDIDNDISIYGDNKISMIISGAEGFSGVIIQSTTLHKSLQNIFNFVWEHVDEKCLNIK